MAELASGSRSIASSSTGVRGLAPRRRRRPLCGLIDFARCPGPRVWSSSPDTIRAAPPPTPSSRRLVPNVGPACSTPSASRSATRRMRGGAVQLLCDHAHLSHRRWSEVSAHPRPRCTGHRPSAGSAGTGYEPPLGEPADQCRRTDRARVISQPRADRHAARRGARRGEVERRRGLGRRRRRTDALALPEERIGPTDACTARHREFVLRHPQVAGRLLDRVAQQRCARISAPVLQPLVPLRYRFWNPALVRVAQQARTCSSQVRRKRPAVDDTQQSA